MNFKYPLMRNNFSKEDFKPVISLLNETDPKLTQGNNVKLFEQEWSKWLGVKYSVFVSSGSAANLLTLAALKIKYPEGGEIIVPPLTWISDITSVIQNGFKPIFVDINLNTLSLDNEKVISQLNDKTRAVFITHAQGFNGLTDNLINELEKRDIILIEDVCESHGAKHNNKKLGTIGWASNFSFYYAHHMSTIEGGMICTNDYEVYQNLKMLRGHGMLRESDDKKIHNKFFEQNPELNKDFIFVYNGYNLRNTEIGALLGLSQLKKLDHNIYMRNINFNNFLSKIDSQKYKTDFVIEGCSNYALNVILNIKDDLLLDKLMEAFNNNGVEFRRGSAGGGNQLRQPYLEGFIPKNHYKKFPNTEHVHFYGFYIGNFPNLTSKEVEEICLIINNAS
jgi:CDP-4-dehydro-6-deoxyglucose reductase, E1